MNLILTVKQKRLADMAQQAWLAALNLSVLACREGNARGRLERLLALSDRANRRAERRYQASIAPKWVGQ